MATTTTSDPREQRLFDRARIEVTRERLVYAPESPHSFFADAWRGRRLGDQDAADRLARHEQQAAVEMRAREVRRERRAAPDGVRFGRARGWEQRAPAPSYSATPPLWLESALVPAARPDDRVLPSLCGSMALPAGVATINLPAFVGGTAEAVTSPVVPVAQAGLADAASTSTVVQIAGMLDAPLSMIELGGPWFDLAVYRDLVSAYDFALEQQMLSGTGGTGPSAQLVGLSTVAGSTVTYTDASPKALAMYPFIGQLAGSVANLRKRRPTALLLRFGRWEFLTTGEDDDHRPLGCPDAHLPAPQTAEDAPDPIGALVGINTYSTEAIPSTLGAAANQDAVYAIRENDLYLWESEPTLHLFTDVLSGSLAGRIQLRRYAAFIARYASSVATLSGSGMAIQTNE